MFEYKFVRSAVIFGKALRVDPKCYQPVIEEHSAQGWRLVQVFLENPTLIPSEYVIIFERSK
jgi:Domain of unknown function (DUF4177)